MRKEEMLLRKILVLLFFTFILSGCATYKFQKPTAAASQGYLVSYDGKPIIEYTVGKEKSLPDLALAKERFRRRRSVVEYYYKNMGQIESRFKENFWDFPAMFMDFVGGILRWPFTAVSDYRYNHNPKYKERVDKLEEENEAFEKARIDSLKEKLQAYIAKDLAKEHLPESAAELASLKPQPQALPVVPEPPAQTPASPVTQGPVTKTEGLAPMALVSGSQTTALQPAQGTAAQPVVEQALPPVALVPVVAPRAEVKLPVKPAAEPPVAVIIAKPVKGYSALKVKFSGQKSYSKSGKIVSYLWDFGDGDTSTQKNPENTYWSTTYGLRKFTATLTVKDEAGGTSSAAVIIEVSTP